MTSIAWSGAIEYLGNQVIYKVSMLLLPWLVCDCTRANQILLINQLRTSCYLIYTLIKY